MSVEKWNFAVMRWLDDGNRLSVHRLSHVIQPKLEKYQIGMTGLALFPGFPGKWNFRILKIGDKKEMQTWLSRNILRLTEDVTDNQLEEEKESTEEKENFFSPLFSSPIRRKKISKTIPTPDKNGTPRKTPKQTPISNKNGIPEKTQTPNKNGTPKKTSTPNKNGTPKKTPTPNKNGTQKKTPTSDKNGTQRKTPTPLKRSAEDSNSKPRKALRYEDVHLNKRSDCTESTEMRIHKLEKKVRRLEDKCYKLEKKVIELEKNQKTGDIVAEPNTIYNTDQQQQTSGAMGENSKQQNKAEKIETLTCEK